MKIIITVFIIAACLTMVTNGLFSSKFKDGCDPNPCKNKATCQLLTINKNFSTCECQPGWHGKICDLKTGCSKNPCKHGLCRDDSIDPSDYHCKCEPNYVGEKCDTENKCLTKNPCKEGSICSLDEKLKPVCECPPGLSGKDCHKRNCTIIEFKGKHFGKGKVYIDQELKQKLNELDSLAKLCNVQIQVTKSFLLQQNHNMTADFTNAPFYTGRAIKIEVLDPKTNKVICDEACLGKMPIANSNAKCLIDGLANIKLKYSLIGAGIIHDGSHLDNPKHYNERRKFKQVGCEKENLPKSDVVMTSSLPIPRECPKGMVGPKCDKEDLCVKKNPCNDGNECSLDSNFKPVCECPPGTAGKKCEKKNCTIVEFKGKYFEKLPKVWVNKEMLPKFEQLDKLAKNCSVKIYATRSFNLQASALADIDSQYAPFYIGHGIEMELHDLNGRLLCNSFCLGKYPTPLANAKCFTDGLQAISMRHSNLEPGLVHDGLQTSNPVRYNMLRKSIQNGCKNEKF